MTSDSSSQRYRQGVRRRNCTTTHSGPRDVKSECCISKQSRQHPIQETIDSCGVFRVYEPGFDKLDV